MSSNDFEQIIRGRRSVRRFEPTSISDAEIRSMVGLAVEAPSANNKQMWKFVAIKDQSIKFQIGQLVKDKVKKLLGQDGEEKIFFYTFFEDAPVVFAVFAGPDDDYRVIEALQQKGCSIEEIRRLRGEPNIQSVSAAIQNLVLAAYARGYGSCWMTAPAIAEEEIGELLQIEKSYQLIAFVPVGLPKQEGKKFPKKLLEEVLTIV